MRRRREVVDSYAYNSSCAMKKICDRHPSIQAFSDSFPFTVLNERKPERLATFQSYTEST